MPKTIDARGLACPAPVLMAKKAVDDAPLKSITMVVDNQASMENVSRFFASRSFGVDVVTEDGDFRIIAKPSMDTPVTTATSHGRGKTEQNMDKGTGRSAPESWSSAEREQDHRERRGEVSRDGTEPKKIMVLAATDRMGFGDDDLGKKLMISFVKTIAEMGDELWHLVFVNNGVKLTIQGSPVLEDLLQYEAQGLKILVCGTCLTHFNLMDAKKVGETTNMLDIVTAMQLADKVIQL
ncbi:MAG: sulfurtransferase-like selenium metabolism protein YedF [Desulfamplus sp.]|nr:sulfurtransferase-like selenium metabolism protein YedF [Desulfamplus sp.]